MKKFEVVNEETSVLRLIDKLRIEDVKDNSITVVYKEGFKHSTLRYAEVNFKKSSGNLWDRFVAKVGDSAAEKRVFNALDLSQDEREKYQSLVDNGAFLVFVEGYNLESLDKSSPAEEDTNESEDLGHLVDMHAHDLQAVKREDRKKTFDTSTHSENADGITIDMNSYVVTSPGLEPEQDEGNEESPTHSSAEEDTLSGIKGTRPLREVPENPDYTVKDNVVDLGKK